MSGYEILNTGNGSSPRGIINTICNGCLPEIDLVCCPDAGCGDCMCDFDIGCNPSCGLERTPGQPSSVRRR